MTIKEMFNAMIEANETGTPKIGIFQADLSNVRLNKKGKFTTITFQVRTSDFTPNDAMTWERDDASGGLVCWAFLGTVKALKKLGVE